MNNAVSRFGLLIFFVLFAQLSFATLPAVDEDGKPFPSLAPMLKEVNPAVVNISTYSTQQYRHNPLLNDPFFRHFFNLPQPQQRQPQKRQQSAGSGVIVNAKKGIVMTNYHVIKDADEVQVSLVDGRSFKAKVVGSDPDLDIGILTIKANDLVDIPLADSDQLDVGDYVVAIGNPFGLGQTVTTGIVSALGRTGLGIHGYENFIQTDASINPGNSGGALVNLKGELVGINTAIIAPSGGNVGIGFAIPTNMAEASMEQILDHGEVRRGQLGISIQDITPDLRRAFQLENGQKGVLISSVAEGSPADKAGIKAGDIVIAVNGQATPSTGQLRSQIGMRTIGEKIKLTYIREGKEATASVKVGKPEQYATRSNKLHPLLKGATVENYSDGGVVISSLAPNSPAAYSGLRSGDIITGANQQRVFDVNSFKKALSKNSRSILLHIHRNGGSLYLVIR
ncbi:MAG: DegQ family serine endoprotease [Cellvibrionaceae bacterium]